jgi:ATP-dependent DNA helicase
MFSIPPQMDAQAADRAHRIGQTKPVLIFRLVSKHTIEARIMQRATEKRQLEALVIAKGKFRAPSAVAVAGAKGDAAQDTAALLALEGEQIEVVPSTAAGRAGVLSDADLDALLDRSPEVFAERRQGWAHAKAPADGEKREGAAFAVFEAPVDTGNGALANMLGEEELPA